jgi:hypothetical protein
LNTARGRVIAPSGWTAPENVLQNISTRGSLATLPAPLGLLRAGTSVEYFCENIEWIHVRCAFQKDKERKWV